MGDLTVAPKLNPFQFGLRKLLALIGTISIGLAIYVRSGLLGLSLGAAAIGAIGMGIGIRKKRRLPVIVGFLFLLSGLFVASDYDGLGVEDGEFTLALRIAVVDSETSAPITAAEVGVADWHDEERYFTPNQVNNAGLFDYRHVWPWSRTSSPLGIARPRRAYEILLTRIEIHAQAPGYEPAAILLSDALGREGARIGEALPMVTVRLQKSPGGGAGSD